MRGEETRATAGQRRMSGFSLQFNPCPRVPPALDDGILNGDTKATLVAWGDDITFLDRDEDDAAAASRGDSRQRRNAPSFCNLPLCSLSLSLSLCLSLAVEEIYDTRAVEISSLQNNCYCTVLRTTRECMTMHDNSQHPTWRRHRIRSRQLLRAVNVFLIYITRG